MKRPPKDNLIANNLKGEYSACDKLIRTKLVPRRKFHTNYDPNIELRQVGDRFDKRQTLNANDKEMLNDEEDEDLQKYTEKMKKQCKKEKIETDTSVLARRQGEIDKGKSKQCYKDYIYRVAKDQREPFMPRTPNKFKTMSRRGWEGTVKKWKKHIYAWNEPNFEEFYASGVTFEYGEDGSQAETLKVDKPTYGEEGNTEDNHYSSKIIKEEKEDKDERSIKRQRRILSD